MRTTQLPLFAASMFLAACAGVGGGPGEGRAELYLHPDLILSKLDGSSPPAPRIGSGNCKTCKSWIVPVGPRDIEIMTTSVTRKGGSVTSFSMSMTPIKFQAQSNRRYFATTHGSGERTVSDEATGECWFSREGPVDCKARRERDRF